MCYFQAEALKTAFLGLHSFPLNITKSNCSIKGQIHQFEFQNKDEVNKCPSTCEWIKNRVDVRPYVNG